MEIQTTYLMVGVGLMVLLGAYLIWDMNQTAKALIKQAEDWCKGHKADNSSEVRK